MYFFLADAIWIFPHIMAGYHSWGNQDMLQKKRQGEEIDGIINLTYYFRASAFPTTLYDS